jgi:hypothetical protein
MLKSVSRARPEAAALFENLKRMETLPPMRERLDPAHETCGWTSVEIVS